MIYDWQQLQEEGFRSYFSPTTMIQNDKMLFLLEIRYNDDYVWMGNVDDFDLQFINTKCNEWKNK